MNGKHDIDARCWRDDRWRRWLVDDRRRRCRLVDDSRRWCWIIDDRWRRLLIDDGWRRGDDDWRRRWRDDDRWGRPLAPIGVMLTPLVPFVLAPPVVALVVIGAGRQRAYSTHQRHSAKGGDECADYIHVCLQQTT
jgi:hypothetical protein